MNKKTCIPAFGSVVITYFYYTQSIFFTNPVEGTAVDDFN